MAASVAIAWVTAAAATVVEAAVVAVVVVVIAEAAAVSVCPLRLTPARVYCLPPDYGYGGSSSGGFRDDAGRRGFQEYDAGDDEELPRRSNSVSSRPSAQRRSSAAHASVAATPVTPKAPEPAPAPAIDLLGMDDDFASPPPSASTGKALPTVSHQATTLTDGMLSPIGRKILSTEPFVSSRRRF